MPIPEHKQKSLTSLKKASSLLDKIIKMTEDNKYCVDIMQHNLAVVGLLKSAHHTLMEGHMQTCFKKAFETKDKKAQQKIIDEIMQITKHSANCLINKVKS
ncbi:MAG: metal-sensing transcriptional repressor [Patescibacteria group bacterium]